MMRKYDTAKSFAFEGVLCSFQENIISVRERMAHPKGFEPLTPRFVVWCSIQLSYGCLPRVLRLVRHSLKNFISY